jgi:hypothetical protein
MYIPKDYALSNEIAEHADIAIANFSTLRKQMEDHNVDDVIIKYGNCTFVNTKSYMLPNYLRKAVQFNYTNLENLILISYLTSEFSTTKAEFIKAYIKAGYGDNVNEISVVGKKFLEVSEAFLNETKGKMITNIHKTDLQECISKGYIDNSMQLSKGNYLVWYTI